MEPRERLTRDIAILEMARMLCKRECVMRHRCDNCHPHSQLFELAGNLLEAAGIADAIRDRDRLNWLEGQDGDAPAIERVLQSPLAEFRVAIDDEMARVPRGRDDGK